ncbi:MAG TPA: antibiotic biosynthesis monooxygenase [Candidatus Angelobacter sp.]|nr:antibiotic biosynthesis monooxygenase [Candidatus Angelobacter sp.]
MVVVSNRIPVAKGTAEEFERRWKNRKWTIANHPGFIRTEVLKPVRADHYVVVTRWQTMKDFEDWSNSDAFHGVSRERSADTVFLRTQQTRNSRNNSRTLTLPSHYPSG